MRQNTNETEEERICTTPYIIRTHLLRVKHTGIRKENIRTVVSKAQKQEIVLMAFMVTNLPD